ncbi:extracellular solute-binding protein [Microbacterium testaceum]|uniref:ABC transporter substrate-binding protein n=1 Tax=Microbacterium testaceum TaxID=2033 RepID=UPI003431C22A
MRIFTRVAIGAAAAALALPMLTACGSNGGVGGNAPAAQQTDGPVTLNYWTWYPDEKSLQPAIDAFEKANPDITVNLRVFASQDYQKQLPLALNGGEDIDVVGIQVSAMTNTIKDKLLPVSDYASDLDGDYTTGLDSKLLDQTAAAASDGKLYGLPMGGVSSAYLYYNNELLQANGIAVPKTAADLAAASAKLKAAGIATPVVESGEGWWQEEVLFSIAGQKYPDLSDSLFVGNASWDQPEVVDSLTAYKSLFDSGAIDPSVLSLTGSAPDEAFTSGKAAFLIGGSWGASMLSASFRQANGIGLTDVGATPLPVVDGGQPAVRGLAEGGMGIPAASTHKAAAAKFISYMTYGDGVELWNKNLVYAPAAKVGFSLGDDVLTTDAARQGVANIAAVSAEPGSIRTSQQDFLNTVEGPTILDVLRGNISAQDAAAKLQSEWSSGRYPKAGQ